MQFWYFHHLQRVRLSIANRLHGPIPISFCFGENFQQNFQLKKKKPKIIVFSKTDNIYFPARISMTGTDGCPRQNCQPKNHV